MATPGVKVIGNPGTLQLEPAKGTRILGITLTVKSEPTQLPEGKPVFRELRVSTPAGNSGDVYLADTPASISTGPRYAIAAGKEQVIKVSEVSSLYYGGTLNDILSIFAEVVANG